MRILYLTQWFDPEPNVIKGPAFVAGLVRAGHSVTVVTGFPNYPTGRLYPGYRLRFIQREMIEGVTVVRLPLYPSHDRSSLRRSLNYLSFCVSVLLYCLFRRERFDLAYVYHPPITVGLAAALAGLVRRLPFVLDVQDLWPDTLSATGMRGGQRLAPIVGSVCRFVYARAAAIVVQSDGIGRRLVARGVSAGRIVTVYNWARHEYPEAVATQGGRTTLVYAGNFGPAQALVTLMDAAALLERDRSDVEILLYGDGIEDDALRARARALGLSNLRFAGRVSQDEIAHMFARADALLLHLADDPLFEVTVPSKLQAYLAAGRPIIAGLAGEGAGLLRASGAAFVAAPGDPQALAALMRNFADLAPSERAAMGLAGRYYYQRTFAFERGLARTLAVIEASTGTPRSHHGVATQ